MEPQELQELHELQEPQPDRTVPSAISLRHAPDKRFLRRCARCKSPREQGLDRIALQRGACNSDAAGGRRGRSGLNQKVQNRLIYPVRALRLARTRMQVRSRTGHSSGLVGSTYRFGNLSVVVSNGVDTLLAEYVHPGHVPGLPPHRGGQDGVASQTAPGSGLGQGSSGHAGLLAALAPSTTDMVWRRVTSTLFPTISRSRSLDPCFRPCFRG